MARRLPGIVPTVCALSLGWASTAGAVVVVLDYDGAKAKDHVTAPYYENGVTTTVDAGHYDFYADATGEDGDQAFNIDDHQTGPSSVTITAQGLIFDVVSLDVINPADPATGESYTITAIGGGAGSIPAPAVTGPLAFGPGFHGITALKITQNPGGSSKGAFAFDDLTIQSLPEPAVTTALVAGALAAFALRRRAR
jgi:hypothetical protein